jgi:PucR C-terminal helix-turn-helix domain/GGDEF-like domain
VSKRGLHSPAHSVRLAGVAGRSRRASASVATFDEACATIASRFRARFPELEASLATLVDEISNPREVADYLDSLHATRTAILEYIADVIEIGERRAPGVPPAVLASARLAARSGVALDAVLRRYSAGNAFFGDVLIEEAEHVEVPRFALRRLLHRQATTFDCLLEAVCEEYVREAKSRPTTTGAWRHEYIQGLLAGRLPNGEVELDYDLDGHHLGLMARGDGAREVMRGLAKRLDRRLLASRPEEEPVWACWLGGRSPLEAAQVLRALGEIALDQAFVAVGEPGEGLSGWRLSHRQAKAALPIAVRRGEHTVRYADVAVLASILCDDLGTISLRQLYLEPLESGRDGGKVARETLRAYFATERNISSTAAALGVDRGTVKNRIRAIEELFGRPLSDFATDLETALRLAD